jgi:hypothetical protein
MGGRQAYRHAKAGWQRRRQECMQAKSSKEAEPGQQTDSQAGAGKDNKAHVGRQAETGKGSKQRQARASKQVGRGMKQRSKEAGKGRLGRWQVNRVEKQRDSHAADAGSLADRQASAWEEA